MTFAPSLFEPNLKGQWAKKHLDSLRSEIDLFVNLYPYEVFGEEDFEAGEYVVKIIHPPIFEVLPAVLSLGDFATCLRASLDYLAWQLSLLSGNWPTRDINFPIFEKNSKDTQNRIAKSTFGIPDSAITIVKSLQPYQSGDDFRSTHLWRLAKLSNIDKHRHVSAYRPVPPWQVRFRGEYAEPPWEVAPKQIDNCTVMRLPLAAKDYVDFNPDRGIDLRFFDDKEGINVGYHDLVEIYDFVTNSVIPAFAGFFPTPTAMVGQSL